MGTTPEELEKRRQRFIEEASIMAMFALILIKRETPKWCAEMAEKYALALAERILK